MAYCPSTTIRQLTDPMITMSRQNLTTTRQTHTIWWAENVPLCSLSMLGYCEHYSAVRRCKYVPKDTRSLSYICQSLQRPLSADDSRSIDASLTCASTLLPNPVRSPAWWYCLYLTNDSRVKSRDAMLITSAKMLRSGLAL
jgi:hypothetical protein